VQRAGNQSRIDRQARLSAHDGESQFAPSTIAGAFYRLAANIGETLMWFYIPAILIGIRKHLLQAKRDRVEVFFVVAAIAMNMAAMIWLYCRHGYMADRHVLPLLIIPVLYIPVGLVELALWLQARFARTPARQELNGSGGRFWFLILFMVGTCICAPKLLTPVRLENRGYRAAAEWLKAHTGVQETVAVPDARISFYAERRGLLYGSGGIPGAAAYVVAVRRDNANQTGIEESFGTVEYEYVAKTKGQPDVTVYKKLQR